MNPKAIIASVVFTSGILFTSGLFAQAPKVEFPAPSPACTLKQRVGLTDIEVVYSRPSLKGRTAFGGVVPYNQVWRTGANAATTISFSTPVKLNGNEVPAGKYALYTIPGETEWTVILSKNTTANIFTYSPTNDLARFKATPITLTETIETFMIEFNQIRDESAVLNLIWETTVVPISLQVDVTSKLVPQIEEAMTAPGDKKPYYQAALYYFEHGLDLQKAAKWINAAAAQNETYYILHLKAKILAKTGDKEGATAAAKRSTELAIKAEGPKSGYVKLNEELISSLH
jgi:hypothetical protein